MSWLLEAEFPVYAWSNSSYCTTTSETPAALAPAFTNMNSTPDSSTSTCGVSNPPQLTCHDSLVSSSQQWNTSGLNVILQPNHARPILRQATRRNLKPDAATAKETCNNHGTGGVRRRRGVEEGQAEGAGAAVGSSSDHHRLVRRREQNRRAAVNCRMRKKERATNSLLEFQKFQCSNTDLRNVIRLLTERRNSLLQQLTSLCQPCASLVSPLPTTDTQVAKADNASANH